MTQAVSRSRVIPAAPQAIFDVLANPRMHSTIDGSGTVRGAISGPPRLSMGASFGVRMRNGLPYVVRNTVVEYDEGRRIAWRHFGRHRWRYELEPVDGGTRVTETFDYSTALSPRLLELMKVPAMNAKGIKATLERLAELFTPEGTATGRSSVE